MTSSDARRERRRLRANLPSLIAGGYWALLVFVMHVPLDREEEVIEGIAKHADKAVHFAAFGLFTLLLCWVWHERPMALIEVEKRRCRQIALGVLLFTIVYAALDEALQPLTGRDGNVPDFVADVIGAISGTAAYRLIVRM